MHRTTCRNDPLRSRKVFCTAPKYFPLQKSLLFSDTQLSFMQVPIEPRLQKEPLVSQLRSSGHSFSMKPKKVSEPRGDGAGGCRAGQRVLAQRDLHGPGSQGFFFIFFFGRAESEEMAVVVKAVLGFHFGIGAPPILEPIVRIGMFTGGTGF